MRAFLLEDYCVEGTDTDFSKNRSKDFYNWQQEPLSTSNLNVPNTRSELGKRNADPLISQPSMLNWLTRK